MEARAFPLLEILPSGRVVDVRSEADGSPPPGEDAARDLPEAASATEEYPPDATCPHCGGPAYRSRRMTARERVWFFVPLYRCRRCRARYFYFLSFPIRAEVQ